MGRVPLLLAVVVLVVVAAQSPVQGSSFTLQGLIALLRGGVRIADQLTGINGQVDRGNNCAINWNVNIYPGFKVRWMGVCVDTCTGVTSVSKKNSRSGALEHCLEDIYTKMARRGLLTG
ncbi:uncharacterized protein LOC106180713 [Lingula anatina]|uniref:Uncharacterized protein LOC106180713 n=1 Tax=Lingula anatina TaxID=7574 RepID=A0A1S3KC87_LINAN|nr:uncharacterized protein LOC106180713 [Lingula anatina]|eukprot:XP_013420245.1 uncharacterized protein LOC106180713 [Lingula anatina]